MGTAGQTVHSDEGFCIKRILLTMSFLLVCPCFRGKTFFFGGKHIRKNGSGGTGHSHRQSCLRAQKENAVSHKVLLPSFLPRKEGGSDGTRHSHRQSCLRAQKGNAVSHKVLLPSFLPRKEGGSDGTHHSHRQSCLRAQKGNAVSHKVLCQAFFQESVSPSKK